MITIIEAYMTKLQHAYPNGIYTRIFYELANKKLKLFCSNEHYSVLGIDDLNIQHYPIKVLEPKNSRILKFLYEYKQTKKIIKESNSDLIVLLSCFPPVQLWLTLYSRKHNSKRIIIMTHGEAEGLILPGKKWKFWSYPFWMNLCFKYELPKNIFRIVLGESIRNNMKAFLDSDQIYYINQPRDNFKDKNDILPSPRNNIFAFIGNCLYKKGGESFVNAADMVRSNSDSIFEIIGAYDLDESISSNLTLLSKPHEMIPRNLFNEALEKITYACFPYPSNTYMFTASGAVLDAVIYLKPIVYIKNDYFDGIFKDAGDIGYRCEDELDFIKTIKNLDENADIARYKQQVENLKQIQNKFSVANVTKQIKSIVTDIEAR